MGTAARPMQGLSNRLAQNGAVHPSLFLERLLAAVDLPMLFIAFDQPDQLIWVDFHLGESHFTVLEGPGHAITYSGVGRLD